jgi:hypothetical protein
MRRLTTLLLALAVSAGAFAQAPALDLAAGDLHFTLNHGSNIRLTLRGVPVIQESRLYIMQPGWTGSLLNQDTDTPRVTSSTEGDVQVGTADYETKDAWARYRFEVHPDNTFKVALTFAGKGAPAIVEYDAAYLNANILAGRPFTAQTVDGERKGTVPLFAASADQTASKLSPNIRSLAVDTVLGRMTLTVEGSDALTNSLTLFDARAGTQTWARRNPIFWLGIGVPAPTLPPGEHSITITFQFGVPNPNVTIPAAEGAARIRPVGQALVPYTPERPVIPRPKDVQPGNAPAVRLSGETQIVIPDQPSEEEKQGARELQAELKDFWAVSAPIRRASNSHAHSASVARLVLTRPGAITQWFGKADAVDEPEGYTLATAGSAVIVNGADPRGAYYGAQTLKQLLRADARGVYVKNVSIRDWPSLKFRGVHWFGGPNSLPFHEKMIARIVAPLKMNAMVYQADYTQWATQPNIWNPERSTPKDDVRRAVEYARAHFLEPIPLVNTLGHSEWLFGNDQNLDISADPNRKFAYDPDNPRTYDVVLPILQEAINLFHPKIFHIGHDEVTTSGRFPPEGSKKSATDLIIEDTVRLHDWLARRGIKTMMWGDMLLYKDEASDAGLAPTKEDAAKRRAALPKDIVIADWHYQGSDPKFPSVDVLQKDGFQVVGTTWFDWGNIQNFSRALTAQHAEGLLQSTWAGYNMSVDAVTGPELKQFVAYLVAAEYAWNGGKPDVADLGYSPDDAFMAMWNRAPVRMAKRPGFTVDLTGLSNAGMWDWIPAQETPPAGNKTSAIAAGRQTLGGVTFDTGHPVWLAGGLNPAGAWPSSVEIPLGGRKPSTLHLLWGATFSAPSGTPVASVTLTYADGTTEVTPVKYGEGIFAFSDLGAGSHAAVVWRGSNAFGERVAIRDTPWPNPHPEKPLKSITVTSLGTEAAPVLLGLTGIL